MHHACWAPLCYEGDVEDASDGLKFNDQGLIPAIVQDRLTGEVRMLAWMNRESLEHTRRTGHATFYSRSRKKLWTKGEESGNVLVVERLMADCDGDTLLVLCDPKGPSCHTGADNCFFVPLDKNAGGSVRPLVGRLESVLEARKESTSEKSYTRSLFDGGAVKIGSKIREESGELSEALENESDERVASEAADVVYHMLVGLRLRNVPWRAVLSVLAERFGVGGHVEKAARE
jgi:phosphoribosyl-AMP cyclohydrolase / phosphoribosyl-ATP pyrophosphohydrolase